MKLGLYCIFDSVSDSAIVIGTAPTDGAFIRQNVPYLSKMNDNYLNDYKVFKVGEFTESTMEVTGSSPTPVSWDAYGNPETKATIVK
ncbi:MAG: hypothetical protein [Microviridae sp.]|nr:MAG: hypothetical protein [Microviridae sp.]